MGSPLVVLDPAGERHLPPGVHLLGQGRGDGEAHVAVGGAADRGVEVDHQHVDLDELVAMLLEDLHHAPVPGDALAPDLIEKAAEPRLVTGLGGLPDTVVRQIGDLARILACRKAAN